MTPRILFADIDGTILSHTTGQIPETTLQCINALQKKGIQVWGCTGRNKIEISHLPLDNLHLDGWITMNGAYCYQNDTVIYHCPIDFQDLSILFEALDHDPFPVQFFEADMNYMNMVTQDVIDSLAKIHTEPDPIMDPHHALQHPVYMFIPWLSEDRWSSIARAMQHTTQVRWNDLAVDCFSDQCGKDKGIEAILEYLGIGREDAVAIGDGENDIAMFQACDSSIAMGNATKEVKEKATYITKNIDENGFYEIISQIFEL